MAHQSWSGMRYHKYISLGHACQPAHYIRNVLHQQEAYFFDWLVTPVGGLCKLIEFGPETLFFDKQQFRTVDEPDRKKATVTHNQLGVVFYHEFPRGPQALNAFPTVEMKFRHLAQKWHGLNTMRSKVLFIRHYAGKADSLLIATTLRETFPDLPFDLLSVNEDEANKDPWGIPGIINMCVDPTTTDWKGDSEGWTHVLKTVCV